MMHKIAQLTKVFLKNSYQNNQMFPSKSNHSNGKKIFMKLLYLILVLYLIGIFGFFSYGIIQALSLIHQEAVFLGLFFMAIAFLVIFQTIFTSINVFYFSKDLEFILPLPLKPVELLVAKFNTILITEYITEFVFAIGPVFIYGILTSASPVFYGMAILVLLLFPILPAILSSLIIMIIMSFAKLSRNKDKFQLIATFIAIAFAIGIQFVTNGNQTVSQEQLAQNLLQANGLVQMVSHYFITIGPTLETLTSPDFLSSLIGLVKLVGMTIASYFIFIVLGNKLYLKGVIGNLSSSSGAKHRKKQGPLETKKSNLATSYVIKELKSLFRNTIFFTQCVLSVILIPVIFTVVFFVSGNNMTEIISQITSNVVYTPYFICALLGIIQFFFCMSFSSVTAISRDGGHANFTKYIPVPLYKQFIYKAMPGILLNIIPILFTLGVVYFVVKDISIFYLLLVFLLAMILNVLNNYFGFLVDLKRPKLEWDTEYAVVKQNMNMMFLFILTFIVIGLLVLLCVLLGEVLTLTLFITLLFALFLGSTILIDRYIHRNQSQLFEKIS